MKGFIKKLLREGLEDMVWYHGTSNNFTKFDMNSVGSSTDDGWWGHGIYFHSDKDRGGYGNIVKSVRLNFKNPITLPSYDVGGFLYNLIGEKANLDVEYKEESPMNIIRTIGKKEFTNICLSLGYDGLIIKYVEGTSEAVVFDDSVIQIINQNVNELT